jgi:hypothetical protein
MFKKKKDLLMKNYSFFKDNETIFKKRKEKTNEYNNNTPLEK